MDSTVASLILHSKTKKFQNLVQKTKQEIQIVCQNYSRIGVSFSGGKDSGCMLDLMISVCPEKVIPVFFDSDGVWQSSYDLIVELEQKYKTKIQVIKANFGYKKCWDKSLISKEVLTDSFLNKVIVYDNAIKAKNDFNLDLQCIGIRADESKNRKIRFRAYENHRYTQKTGIYQFAPLEKWSKNDVWAYLLSNNIPYNSVYHKFSEVFGEHFTNYRVDSYLEQISIAKGSFKVLRQYYPQEYAECVKYLEIMSIYTNQM